MEDPLLVWWSLLWLGVITGSGPGAATTRVWVTLTAWDTPILQVYCPAHKVGIEDIVCNVVYYDVESIDNIDMRSDTLDPWHHIKS